MKAGSFPAKANVLAQRVFYESILQPLMKKAKKRRSKHVLLFIDGSHNIFGGDYLGYVYGVYRRFTKTFSGRQRLSVLACLNYVTKKVSKVATEDYITALTVCELLRKVALEYAGKTVHIIADNARYQKCAVVMNLANELGIKLYFLPAYSPYV